ncbi:MAG: hypothetical protein GXO62_05870 [Epsilonproteobacteria bacterium]|nr:hypothetical protein [Campylobacterota bacterium]
MKIEKSFQKLTLVGESIKDNDNNILIDGKITGVVEVECVKCLNSFEKEIDEDVKFKIVKPPYNGFDEDYDIIEQEKFDIEEILKSEIESIKSDYNICQNCKSDDFNKEF